MSESGFGINFNLLETNLINIVLLVDLVVLAVIDLMQKFLEERQEKIGNDFLSGCRRQEFAQLRYDEESTLDDYFRKKAFDLEKNQIEDLKNYRKLLLSDYQSYSQKEGIATKDFLLNYYRAFDKKIGKILFSFYKKYKKDKNKSPKS